MKKPEIDLTDCVLCELIRQIQAFQYVRKTNGEEAAPSGWQPGKPALKPGPDLVGKVWEVWKPDMTISGQTLTNHSVIKGI